MKNRDSISKLEMESLTVLEFTSSSTGGLVKVATNQVTAAHFFLDRFFL